MKIKLNKCPKCNNTSLGDRWCSSRKLEQFCYDCDWVGIPRTPEQKEIPTTKKVQVDQFVNQYKVYDRFGHALVISRSYSTPEEAELALKQELEKGKTSSYGPYTGVIWPNYVTVKGKFYK